MEGSTTHTFSNLLNLLVVLHRGADHLLGLILNADRVLPSSIEGISKTDVEASDLLLALEGSSVVLFVICESRRGIGAMESPTFRTMNAVRKYQTSGVLSSVGMGLAGW